MMPEKGAAGTPPLPGVARLGWLLFLQPLVLHKLFKAWGLDDDPSLIRLWPRIKARDPVVLGLLRRWATWVFVVTPALALALALTLHLFAFKIAWLGFFAAMVGGVAGGVAFGVAGGVAGGVALGVAGGVAVGVAFGVAVGVAALLAFFRLPLWILEALAMLIISRWARVASEVSPRLSRWLPFRYHDLIYLPLPGLRSFILQVASIDPRLALTLVVEAAASIGQKRPAAAALVELQARDLERAATHRLFAQTANLSLPFLPGGSALDPDSPIRPFQAAARDLLAGGAAQSRRRVSLERARETIEAFEKTAIAGQRTGALHRRLLPTARLWLDIIREEEQKLAREEAERPEVPLAFVAGPALTPERSEQRDLFKGRADLVRLIEHDLAPEKHGLLLIIGQRRMGKSSLRNWLPHYLGTETIAAADLQKLSGDPRRKTPHRILLDAVAATVPNASPPPESDAWGDGLRWLKALDQSLDDKRVLLVADEVERIQDGIRDGWCSTDVLDFLRAAGSELRTIRILLLTAYPLYQLGPAWVDRMLGATSRSISYLDEASARDLLTRPVPDFPAIYPEGGVDRILEQTHRHPFLLQKVGDELCKLLNERGGRRRATDAELTEVFDRVLKDVDLFDELWRQRSADEQTFLRRLAASSEPLEPDQAARQLLREGYLEKRGAKVVIAVPLFRDWIADTQGGP